VLADSNFREAPQSAAFLIAANFAIGLVDSRDLKNIFCYLPNQKPNKLNGSWIFCVLFLVMQQSMMNFNIL